MNEQTSLNSGFHAERDEEKRYYLKYNVPSLIVWGCSKNPRWLHVVRNSGYQFICEDRTDHENVQTIFTESEISQMDITGFKKEPAMQAHEVVA